MKETYIENNLVYKSSNNELFTGIAQSKKKNGHLVYEEVYENGVIFFSNLYFNGKEKRISNKTIYNQNKPFTPSKKNEYHLDGSIFQIIHYNKDGIKILFESYKNGKLIYSCQYSGKKKHGFEIGYDENNQQEICKIEYSNGKKIK
ncbi:hypothetical protein V8G69_16265 [Gaetbulibacter sp. M235]|uniref:hypothetical protein n=1 Tax=Gaetbulibacter sp. M235 TaxID=3126510 RepID=UPI00374E2DDA